MKDIGIFYGSVTGTTAAIASRIAKMLNVDPADVHNVAESAPSDIAPYKILIFGTSTWGDGEMDDSWLDFSDGVEELDLHGRKIALFGCGDETMSDTFCSGVGKLYHRLEKTGAEFIAPYDTVGYTFNHTDSMLDNDLAVGLLLDEVNHPEATDIRLRGWTAKIQEAK